MTTLFSHPRQPHRRVATIPADPVPSFIPRTEVELRPVAQSWDAIASTSRRLRRSENATIPSDIVVLDRRIRILIRSFDLAASALLVALTLPLMMLVGLAVALTSRGPVLYFSWRIGRCGRLFVCLKFRTMVRDADAQLPHLLAANPHLAAQYRESNRLRSDPRATRVGRLLRSTHLDELPQLFNVMAGTMSLVGPRPIVPNEMERYGPALANVLAVKPGITGTWQLSKRLGGYAGRVESDLSYLRRRSLFLDLWLCLRTVPLVIGLARRPHR